MQPVVAVAFSGGRDSTALLHATVQMAPTVGLRVLALHVNHGLMPEADGWQARARAQCERWARRGAPLAFRCERLSSAPASGDSVEAWARQQRYLALAKMAQAEACNTVLLAHHRRDQAETFLLQALRGAGVSGLSAMPAAAERQGIHWLRPWLQRPREQIDAYVRRHRLSHVEDGSNSDTRYARNRLRHGVWPGLCEAFPQAEQVLADAAGWAQQASAVLQEVAQMDLARVSGEQGLSVLDWSGLSSARRSNVLRAWLKAETGQVPPASLIKRLVDELAPTAQGGLTGPRGGRQWPLQAGLLQLHKGHLRCELSTSAGPGRDEPGCPRPAAAQPLAIHRAGRHALPNWHGVLEVSRVREGGVPLAWLAQAELRAREGGEQFQAGLDRPPRSLKKQFQAAGVPAYLRDGPLLFSGGQLVFVPGLGLDARVIGLPGQPMVTLHWRATPRS